MAATTDQPTITAVALRALLAEPTNLVLIDVLPPDHFSNRHIPTAQNACVFLVSFLDDLTLVAPDQQARLVVYGAGPRSQDAAVAAEKMARAGYANLSILAGGLEAWREAGYELEGDATDQQEDPQTAMALPDGQYAVDATASQLEWTGRNPTSSHYGTVDIAQGVVEVTGGSITGSAEIDMTSIQNVNLKGDALQSVLEAHLHSDDFFFTKLFPKAVVTLQEANPIEPASLTAPNYHVRGELNLRGVSASLEFDATVAPGSDGAYILEAHFDIDRTRWHVIYGSTRFFEHLGMHKVFDLISLQLRMVIAPL